MVSLSTKSSRSGRFRSFPVSMPFPSKGASLAQGGALPSASPHLAMLGRLTRIFHSSLDPRVILKLALTDTVRLLRATSGSVVLINPDNGLLEIEVSVGLSKKDQAVKLRPGEGIIGWVALHRQAVRIADVRHDTRSLPSGKKIRSEMAVPLERIHATNGHFKEEGNSVIGVLNVGSSRLSAFNEADEELLMALASQMSYLIQNAWLYRQAQRRATQLDALWKLGQSIMAGDTLPEVLNELAAGACQLLKAHFCNVLLLEEDGEYLRSRATSEGLNVQLQKHLVPVDNSQIGMVVRRRKSVVVYDIQKSDPYPFARLPRFRKLASLLGVPLLRGDQVLGALALYTSHPRRFSNEDIQIISALANQAALAIQRVQLSQKLVSTEEELRQSERLSAIGLLAAEVAHEIRNPLTVIKMLSHSLEREMPRNDPRRKDFEVLSRKMEQMNQTVERVLGLARRSEPVFEALPLNSVIEDLILLIRHKLTHQKIQLKVFFEKDLPFSWIDRSQMEQALLNIILNALHAMPRGGILELRTGMATSSRSPSPAQLWIEVKDSGIGMSPLQQQSLFRPFLTSRSTGTGLGMAIVNKIIEAHQGRLVVRSRSHRGTAVRIYLRVATSTV